MPFLPIHNLRAIHTLLQWNNLQIYLDDTALDNRTTSIRELLRQLRAKRFTTANPQLAIHVDVHNRPAGPSANFTFVDGTSVDFETNEYHAPEIMFQVHLKGMQLDAEYEMAGKSVED